MFVEEDLIRGLKEMGLMGGLYERGDNYVFPKCEWGKEFNVAVNIDWRNTLADGAVICRGNAVLAGPFDSAEDILAVLPLYLEE